MWNRIPSSSIRRYLPIPSHQIRFYSFESGRKPKSGSSLNPDPDQLSPTNNNETGDSKPIVISGRGRRLNHRSHQSNSSTQFSSTPKLALPFKPLSANHLAHLSPTTLFLDLFFSLQRPLLEIELSPHQRRSITAETRQSKLGFQSDPELESSLVEEDQDDDVYPQINFSSPSDPAFKQPQPSSHRPTLDQNELDDQMGPTIDPYSSFLITEPEGVHPAWSDALKRCLATSQAFLPPPSPEERHSELDTSSKEPAANPHSAFEPEQPRTSFQTGQECQLDIDRQQALNFLAPYGLTKCSKTTAAPSHPQSQTQTVDGDGRTKRNESSFQPGIPQDPLSLTIQAARFLHSVMMANRWPEAAIWTTIESKLSAAKQSYEKIPSLSTATATTDDVRLQRKGLIVDSSSFPPIRGSERPIHSGRRNRPNNSPIQWIKIHAEIDESDGRKKHSISLNIEQLKEIIKYSHKILNQKIGIESIPKSIMKNLEQFGEFLIHKSNSSNSTNSVLKNSSFFNHNNNIDDSSNNNIKSSQDSLIPFIPIVVIGDHSQIPSKIHDHESDSNSNEIVNLDSVFRKKKRKMKVHKYKKRRKARRTLKKRQGK